MTGLAGDAALSMQDGIPWTGCHIWEKHMHRNGWGQPRRRLCGLSVVQLLLQSEENEQSLVAAIDFVNSLFDRVAG